MTKINLSEYITVKEAAVRMWYTQANITKLIREGKLKAGKRGRKYFIKPSDLEAYAFGGNDEIKQFFS